MTEIVERLRATVSPLCHNAAATIEQQAASLAAKDKEIERLRAKCFALERATAHEWFCNQLGEIGFIGIRDYAALQSRAEQAERASAEAVEVIARDITALDEADAQIEYLHGKFKPTGSGANVLAKIDIAATAARAFVAQHGSDSREVG
jgi:hypothetical protein